MGFLDEQCIFSTLNKSILDACEGFCCDHDDLDDFFKNDVQDYSLQLLGKSYCFYLEENPTIIVCALTIANDSIKTNLLPNGRKKKINKSIPHQKYLRSYPAVLIGRLGVNKEFKRQGVGCELMNFIKSWFVEQNNKTGCRFVIVDSYNQIEPISYYGKNGFEFVFSTEDQEKDYLKLKKGDKLETRLMYFDLIRLSSTKPVL